MTASAPGANGYPSDGLPHSLRGFLGILIALTCICILAEVLSSLVFHLSSPYNWPLMPRGDPFRDFYLYKPRYAFFHSSRFFTFSGPVYLYPAPVAVFYRLFYFFPDSTAAVLISLSLTFLVALILFARALIAKKLPRFTGVAFLTAVVLCSYPFAFEYSQANMEFVIWIFVTCGLWAFLKGRGYTSATCFGLAAAMKIYPLILLGLFLSRKQYRQMAFSILVCVFVTLAALWLVCPDLGASWRGTQSGVAEFRQLYILRYAAVEFDHSLFALPKTILGISKVVQHRGLPPSPETLASILSVYLFVAGTAGILFYFVRIRHLPIINQVLCLTIACILLPPVSYDYTLLHLYAPWGLLVFFALQARARFSPGLSAAFLCFAILFAPETEIILHGRSVGGQIKACALVALFTIGMRYRFDSSFDTELERVQP